MRVIRKWSAGLMGFVRRQVWLLLISLFFGVFFDTFVQTNVALAQDWCANPPAAAAKGGFSVSAQKGCAPFTVTVKNTTNSPDNIFLYVYEYKEGDPVADKSGIAATSYTYTRPGRYKILQIGSVNTGSVACQEIEVLDATPPTIRVFTCANLTVQLDIVYDGVVQFSNYSEYIIDWGDGAVETIPNPGGPINQKHTYTSAVTRTISVKGNHSGINCGGEAKQTITPGGTLSQPIINRLATTGNTVTLQVQAAANQRVTVQKQNASGTFEATTITRTGPGTISIPDITAHPTCFRVVSEDGCNNVLASNEVCSIGLEVEAREKQNEVVWTSPGNLPAFQQYTVSRNDAVFQTVTSRDNTSVNDSEGLTCNEDYCYQVTALTGEVEVVSDRVCVTARLSEAPPPFSTVQVSVNGDNRVDLRGLPPVPTSVNPSYKMLVFRQGAGGFVQTGEEQDRNIHQDGGVQPQQQSYCYQVVYQNACGVSSEPSKTVCTIHLGSQAASTINWTAGSPFADEEIDRYVIEKIDDNGVVWEEVTVGTQTSYRPTQNDPDTQRFRFRVKAVSKSGAVSYSNFYTFAQSPRVFVPDAFSPNGDGVNDLLEVKGSTYIESIQMTVYNRWGEVIFRSESREGWNGTIGGQPAPPGSYAYRITTVDQDGLKTEKTGSVLLIR